MAESAWRYVLDNELLQVFVVVVAFATIYTQCLFQSYSSLL